MIRFSARSGRLKVLIVGIEGIGKHALANVLVDRSRQREIELDVVLTNKLPFKDDSGHDVIDYLVLMVDMKSKLSLERLVECMGHVDKAACLSKSCLVVLNHEIFGQHSVSREEIQSFVNRYGMLSVHFCDSDSKTMAEIGSRIISQTVNTERRDGLSPLFLSTLM